MKQVQIIRVPYDSGHRSLRMGAGPEHFIKGGLARLLQDDGYTVRVETIEAESSFPTEIKTAFELCYLLAGRVREAYSQGVFPLVLSGNCNSSLGTLSGIDEAHMGMIWFDAHGDFNTPETRESSFFDGMGMAIAAGRCWRKIAATIPGFRPLPDSNIIHVGGRDFDPEEATLLESSGIKVITAEHIKGSSIRGALEPALEALRSDVQNLYLHVDLDVLDPAETPANSYAGRVPNGLMVEQVEEAIQVIGESFKICAGGIASYDPSYDQKGQTFQAGLRIIKSILATGDR
jgi:arginase